MICGRIWNTNSAIMFVCAKFSALQRRWGKFVNKFTHFRLHMTHTRDREKAFKRISKRENFRYFFLLFYLIISIKKQQNGAIMVCTKNLHKLCVYVNTLYANFLPPHSLSLSPQHWCSLCHTESLWLMTPWSDKTLYTLK